MAVWRTFPPPTITLSALNKFCNDTKVHDLSAVNCTRKISGNHLREFLRNYFSKLQDQGLPPPLPSFKITGPTPTIQLYPITSDIKEICPRDNNLVSIYLYQVKISKLNLALRIDGIITDLENQKHMTDESQDPLGHEDEAKWHYGDEEVCKIEVTRYLSDIHITSFANQSLNSHPTACFKKTTEHIFEAGFHMKRNAAEVVSERIILSQPMSIGMGALKVFR
ncbi:hypothetical protein B9Z19DRAFT_1136791 [Tuber borchii]|uniref:Uncharacterized protein n=1 Tax=Tuber borchii TaxID=42251 RepID=A0A2T6ZB79_TUBBO|nr:hypothetical protein B9Z19DRAFT_1136791 [Tuber borchii]